MGERGNNPCAAAAQRMTDGDGATVRIHDFRIEFGPLSQAGQRLSGKRLIELDGIEV